MKRTRVSAYAFVVASSLAGCTGTGEVEYAGQVRVTSPELVEVSPGVMVIADADEPIFYSRGYYWLYRDGYWFRSDTYRAGFARVDFTYVPNEVRLIDRPQLYVHYRANLGRNRAARTPEMRTRSTQPTYQTPTYQQGQTSPQPTAPAQPPPQTYPTPMPNQPGANPTQPTTPPAPNMPTTVPNDNRREPQPQRNVPPDVDRNPPGNSGNAPGQTDRPQDRDNPGRGNAGDKGNKNAPERSKDESVKSGPDKDTHQHEMPSDKPDRGTPPATTNTDDRTRKNEGKKAKQKKNEKD